MLLGIWLLSTTGYSWWLILLLFLSPDIGMLGYLINTKVGAFTYNVFHHKGLAIAIGSLGYFLGLPEFYFIGILLYTHAAFDRVLGYGLKYGSGFKDTHLGKIGNGAIEK